MQMPNERGPVGDIKMPKGLTRVSFFIDNFLSLFDFLPLFDFLLFY